MEWIAPRRPDVTPERLYWRVDAALSKMQSAGLVRREGRVWVMLVPSDEEYPV